MELNMNEMEQVVGGKNEGGYAKKPGAKRGCTIYKIVSGDTLIKIARRNNTTVDKIMAVFAGHAAWAGRDETRRGTYLREYTALIKFSADGEILWEKQSETGRRFEDVAEYEGKYCVSYYSGLDIPGNICYLWLDADGNELGTTVRSLNRQEIPGEWYGRLMRKMQMEMIPSKEGLWQNIQIINENLTSAGDNYIMSVQQMLVRVPEL